MGLLYLYLYFAGDQTVQTIRRFVVVSYGQIPGSLLENK
jgi:hypothetical protein